MTPSDLTEKGKDEGMVEKIGRKPVKNDSRHSKSKDFVNQGRKPQDLGTFPQAHQQEKRHQPIKQISGLDFQTEIDVQKLGKKRGSAQKNQQSITKT